jgi:hypothetical protein
MGKICSGSGAGEIKIPGGVRRHGVDAGHAGDAAEVRRVKNRASIRAELHDESGAVLTGLRLKSVAEWEIVGRRGAGDVDVAAG